MPKQAMKELLQKYSESCLRDRSVLLQRWSMTV